MALLPFSNLDRNHPFSPFFCFILEVPFLVNEGKRCAINVCVTLREIVSSRQHGFFILLQ